MKVVTETIKVELTGEERETLFQARKVLDEFISTVKTNNCRNIFFDNYGNEYSLSEVENAYEFIDYLSDENPTIE